VHGVDITSAMLELARQNATAAGVTNVEFHAAALEAVPLPDASIDVIISNCVINLTPDKPTAFAEMLRLLRPGGRIGLTDVVADDDISPDEQDVVGQRIECVTGALRATSYVDLLNSAGFVEITITTTHSIAPKLHSAIVQARRPSLRS
jgi:ubiquinone/menaquinone biosynthesis C-methylase UbiE